MTREEFKSWANQHGAAFDGYSEWLKRGGAELIDLTYNALANCELGDAKGATAAMVAGDLEMPRGYGQHAAVVRRWCYAAQRRRDSQQRASMRCQPRQVDGHDAFDCLTCRDEGVVVVLAKQTCEEIVAGTIVGPRDQGIYTALACCTCRRGQFRRSELRDYATLGEAWWTVQTEFVPGPAEFERAKEAVLARHAARRPANYEAAFAPGAW
jgi:hypothetical protein